MTQQTTRRELTEFRPWVPRQFGWCPIQRLRCPSCGTRLAQRGVQFFPELGGRLRCHAKPERADRECGAMLYVLPWPERRQAFVCVATLEQIERLDRFSTEHGRDITVQDIFVELGCSLVPASPMYVERAE